MADYDIAGAFQKIEKELMMSMIRNLKNHRAWEDREDMNWEQWQVLQLKALEEYKKRNREKYGTEFKDINDQIAVLIENARIQGGMDQEIEILEAIKKGFQARRMDAGATAEFFRVNDRKLDALIKATTDDMQKAETAVLRMANDQYRKVIYNAQVYANTGAGTYEKAVDMATKDFISAGLNCVEYANGSRHTLSDYADMAIRTASKRAYLQGEGEMRKSWGVDTVIVNKRGNACPKCLPFCGKVLIDDVWSGGAKSGKSSTTGLKYPLMSKAIAAGLYHPRCKDVHTTYFEGISTPPDDKYTKDELDKIAEDYSREQKQQHAKRQSEKYGRLADYSLDEENKRIYENKAEQWKNIAGTLFSKKKTGNIIEKSRNSGIVKEIRIPDSANEIPGITKSMLDTMQEGIDAIEQEFDLRLDDILVENLNDRFPDTPYLCRYINDDGRHGAVFVLNSGFDFSDMDFIVKEGYSTGYFAGKTLQDHIAHEMAHIMTGRQCETASEFSKLLEELEQRYVSGVSGYSDTAKDGFETIAEAFVRMRNGEKVPDEAKALVEEYVMRWKR